MKRKLRLCRNRFIRNKKSFIFLLILCLGLGFAYLSTQLNIVGNTTVSGNKWSVYFNRVDITSGSVQATVEPTVIGTTTTYLEYTVNLDKPGDFYEFTVEAKNDGTIDAMIDSIAMTTLETNVAKYVNYMATYLDGEELQQKDVLAAKTSTTYKIRVEYKEDIEATDLDESDTDLTLTFGVNYVPSKSNKSARQTSLFVDLIKENAQNDIGLDFSQISSDSNGKGLYVRNGTQTNTNPIYYYRGEVNNNNAKFAGYCWKVVRTTETGGTKLIYNGKPRNVYESTEDLDSSSYVNVSSDGNYSFTFDETNKEWSGTARADSEKATIIFSVKDAGDYDISYKLTSQNGYDRMYLYKDGVVLRNLSGTQEGTVRIYDITPTTVLKVGFTKTFNSYAEEDGLTFHFAKGVNPVDLTCDNTGEESQISTSAYNSTQDALSYVGYMLGSVYSIATETYNSSHKYGTGFTYSNGTYTLTNTINGVDANHHYTCQNTTGTCSTISYVYYYYNPTISYISLTNGKSVENAITEMKQNTTSSTAKMGVDNWFTNMFVPYFTNLSKNYNDYLEDTVWCNDRSFVEDTDSSRAFSKSGWNPNGGSISKYLVFATADRISTGNITLTCPNKADAFTVDDTTNGNGYLTYPVGLLTADEIVLAGGNINANSSYYLRTGKVWWSMTAYEFPSFAVNYRVEATGAFNSSGGVSYTAVGLRPSISVDHDVKVVVGGDGTGTNPYEFVVE